MLSKFEKKIVEKVGKNGCQKFRKIIYSRDIFHR